MRTIRPSNPFLLVAIGLVLAGCTAATPPGPTASLPPSAVPSPLPSPTPSPAPTTSPAAGFTLEVLPPESPPEVRVAIPGSRYCFLVVVQDGAAAPGAVTIEAVADKASVVEIRPARLMPGTVGEVWVVADPATTETTGSVTITASRGGVTTSVTRTLLVFPMADERASDARPYFDRWVAWLAAERPELGISASETWEPVFASTLLVVSHYAYWSEDWEMTVAWHNMIPPYDWTEVHLRQRGVDTAPSLAFRIDSVSEATVPHAVEPPEVVVR
jgi:hypothetical protein